MAMDRSCGGLGAQSVDPYSPRSRAERTINALFARHIARATDPDDPMASVEWVCRAAERLLGMDASCISLIVGGSHRGALGLTDPVLRRIDAAHLGLGEGPCLDAVGQGAPVLLPDFAADAADRWPVFAGHLAAQVPAHTAAQVPAHRAAQAPAHTAAHAPLHHVAQRVGAFYAFPVICGDEPLGALAMYRREPALLPPDVLDAAAALAVVAGLALASSPLADPDLLDPDLLDPDLIGYSRHAFAPGPGPATPAGAWAVEPVLRDRTTVDLAAGIMMAEFGIDSGQALARLRAYAFGSGKDLLETAHDLTGLRLHPRQLES